MNKLFSAFLISHKAFWEKDTIQSLVIGVVFFCMALVIQNIANNYVLSIQGTPVTDTILNILPTWDINAFIILFSLSFTLMIFVIIFSNPKYLLFSIKAVATFLIIRSFFISLTHLGDYPQHIIFDTNIIWYRLYNIFYNTQNDFFFSAHTGLPFLMGLIFFRAPFLRNICFFVSYILGVSVLIGHIHYSIDVFSAPFMSYGIFRLSRLLFRKDYQRLKKGSCVINNPIELWK